LLSALQSSKNTVRKQEAKVRVIRFCVQIVTEICYHLSMMSVRRGQFWENLFIKGIIKKLILQKCEFTVFYWSLLFHTGLNSYRLIRDIRWCALQVHVTYLLTYYR